MLDLARWIVELVGSSSPITHIDRPVRRSHRAPARHHLSPRTELGWEPKVDVVDGLRLTIDWFRQESLVSEPVFVPMQSQSPILADSRAG